MPSRFRSRVNLGNVYQYQTLSVSVGGSSSITGPYLTAYDHESISDVVTPGYASRSKKGETIISPCEYLRESLSSSGSGNAQFTTWDTNGNTTYHVDAVGPNTRKALNESQFGIPMPNIDLETHVRSASIAAMAGIDKTPLSSGEDLAELGETIKFLRSPLQGILRELQNRRIFSLARASAASWATYRFALMPLVRSIHDILSEMSSPTKQPPEIRVSHGRSQKTSKLSGTEPLFSPGDRANLAWSSSSDVSVHCSIRYRLVKPSYDFRWRYGLRNKDILPTFWAVMPLSFMLDRVIDVSQMISAAQNLADPSVQILGASITRRVGQESTCQVTSYSTNADRASYSGSGEVINQKSFSYVRTPYQPSSSDLLPPWKPDGLISDATRIADLVALIVLRL